MPVYKAYKEDIDDLLSLSKIWDEEEENPSPTHPQKLEESIEDGMVFLYRDDEEDENNLLAAMILDENSELVFLKTVYVHPDYRGEGIGHEMLDAFTEMLDKRAISAFLEVDEHNPAIELYEKYGFKETEDGTIPGHIAMMRNAPNIS